jgi:hypothetical protein
LAAADGSLPLQQNNIDVQHNGHHSQAQARRHEHTRRHKHTLWHTHTSTLTTEPWSFIGRRISIQLPNSVVLACVESLCGPLSVLQPPPPPTTTHHPLVLQPPTPPPLQSCSHHHHPPPHTTPLSCSHQHPHPFSPAATNTTTTHHPLSPATNTPTTQHSVLQPCQPDGSQCKLQAHHRRRSCSITQQMNWLLLLNCMPRISKALRSCLLLLLWNLHDTYQVDHRSCQAAANKCTGNNIQDLLVEAANRLSHSDSCHATYKYCLLIYHKLHRQHSMQRGQ